MTNLEKQMFAALVAIETSMHDDRGHLRDGFDWINSAETVAAFKMMREAIAEAAGH